MTKNCWFMDWSASASAPSFVAVFEDTIGFDKTPDVDNGKCLPSSVTYWRRLDGLFVFFLNLDETECANSNLSIDDILDLGAFVSARIKIKLGHQNWSIAAVTEKKKKDASFPTISVCPIKLNSAISVKHHPDNKHINLNRETITAVMEDNALVYALQAKPFGNHLSTLNDTVPAIFLLRRQFAGSFEKALHFKNALKEKTLKVPLLSLVFRSWRFRAYTWHAAVISFVTVSGAYLCWHFASSFGALTVKAADTGFWDKVQIYLSSLIEDALEAVLVVGFPAAAVILLQVVILRRHKTKQAYNKTITLLRLGNIYTDITKRIVQSTGRPPNETNFENAIEITEHMLRIESEKQRSNTWWLIIALTLCAGPFVNFLSELGEALPWLDGIISWVVKVVKNAFDFSFLDASG